MSEDGLRSVICGDRITCIMEAFEDNPCIYCGERAGDHPEYVR